MAYFSDRKLLLYQLSVLFSVLFALVAFSYNVWRMEVTEQNNTIRVASFEILGKLAALEQLVYAAYYDSDPVGGNPRKGWVLVGLVQDLSVLTDERVMAGARELHQSWQQNWNKMAQEQEAVDQIIAAIESERAVIKTVLTSLD